MSRGVKLYDLTPSPNNIKVRCALAYKNIPYERIAVDPANREALVKLSGQPLSPVLVHGDSVVFDSYAITRYLDANWPATPRLYSAERDVIKKIEQWELFNRTDVGPAISIGFGQWRAESPDLDALKRGQQILDKAAARTEEALAASPFLAGAAPTAADFAVGTMMSYGAVPPSRAQAHPVATFFARHYRIQNAPKTVAWIGRVMEWDR